MPADTEGGPRATLRALLVVNRLRETVGYNLAIVVLAVGTGVLVAPGRSDSAALWAAGAYALGVMLLKMHASVADAIHDRAVDAANPEKSVVAAAVERVGVERAWTLLVVELVAGMALVAWAAMHAGAWLVVAGAAIALFGFTYSYPPRLKERGVWNHVVTTGVDAGLQLLPIAAVVAGGLTPTTVVVAALMTCYSFGYHVLHQAADVHYDRMSGVRTFATRIGVSASVALSAVVTGAAAGLSLALGYPLAAVAAGAVTARYVRLYRAAVDASAPRACDLLSARFSIAWVATLLNGALAAAVWRRALGLGAGPLPA